MRTVRVDFLWPNGGLTANFLEIGDFTFSLSSEGPDPATTAGEAGIVLKRFFSGTAAFFNEDDEMGLVRAAVVVVGREDGVAGGLRMPGGLITEGREVVVVDFRTGVADAAGVVLEEVVRSAAVDGANDTLLGLADMPSFFLSSEASTELNDVRFRWDGVEVALVVEGGFFAAETLGRVGGLLRVVVGEDLVAEVVVGFESVEVRGATGLVRGRLGGTPVLAVVGLVGFSSVRDGNRSAMTMGNEAQQRESRQLLYVQSKKTTQDWKETSGDLCLRADEVDEAGPPARESNARAGQSFSKGERVSALFCAKPGTTGRVADRFAGWGKCSPK
jgi:hypothetical protein